MKLTAILMVLALSVIGCKKSDTRPKLSEKGPETKTQEKNIQSIEWMTEEYPPYNFIKEDKSLDGITIVLVKALLKEVSSKNSQIDLLPWARGYALVQDPSNWNCLFGMTRTEEREKLFKWVGPLAPTEVYVEGLKESKPITSEEELKKYSYAIVRDGIASIKLKSLGVEENKMHKVAQVEQMIKFIKSKRADYMAYEWNVLNWIMKSLGYDSKEIDKRFLLKKGELWIACNNSIPDSIIGELQKAFDKIKKDPTVINELKNKFQFNVF